MRLPQRVQSSSPNVVPSTFHSSRENETFQSDMPKTRNDNTIKLTRPLFFSIFTSHTHSPLKCFSLGSNTLISSSSFKSLKSMFCLKRCPHTFVENIRLYVKSSPIPVYIYIFPCIVYTLSLAYIPNILLLFFSPFSFPIVLTFPRQRLSISFWRIAKHTAIL